MSRSFLGMSAMLVVAASAHAEVFSSEFDSFPTDEGWEVALVECDPTCYLDDGWYVQEIDFHACPPPRGGMDAYRRYFEYLNGSDTYFYEYMVWTDGDRSEIPGTAPTALAAANSYGIGYHATVARDQVRLHHDVQQPFLFIDVEPDAPHTIRLELYNEPTPTFRWFVDGVVVIEGEAVGPFPAMNSSITWGGSNWYLTCTNRWNYIRFGTIPADGSGDYDSSGTVDTDDWYFFREYFSGKKTNAGPGGRWADFDFDGDVDCADLESFAEAWTAPARPPLYIEGCPETPGQVAQPDPVAPLPPRMWARPTSTRGKSSTPGH